MHCFSALSTGRSACVYCNTNLCKTFENVGSSRTCSDVQWKDGSLLYQSMFWSPCKSRLRFGPAQTDLSPVSLLWIITASPVFETHAHAVRFAASFVSVFENALVSCERLPPDIESSRRKPEFLVCRGKHFHSKFRLPSLVSLALLLVATSPPIIGDNAFVCIPQPSVFIPECWDGKFALRAIVSETGPRQTWLGVVHSHSVVMFLLAPTCLIVSLPRFWFLQEKKHSSDRIKELEKQLAAISQKLEDTVSAYHHCFLATLSVFVFAVLMKFAAGEKTLVNAIVDLASISKANEF